MEAKDYLKIISEDIHRTIVATVEDEGWHRASAAYSDFLRRHEGLHVLYLELGVGANTPVIVKYPFWKMTMANEKDVYACLNYGEAFLEKRSNN